jgi:hypothetical protein
MKKKKKTPKQQQRIKGKDRAVPRDQQGILRHATFSSSKF